MSGSFSLQLEDLLNPQPKFIDPEDDGDEETKAKVIEKFSEDEDGGGDGDGGLGPSALRKHAASLLQDTDRRYAGKAVSRKQLMKHMEGSEDEEDEEDEDEGEEEDEEEGDEEEEVEEEEDVTQKFRESDEEEDLNDDAGDLNESDVTFPKGVDFRKLTEGMDDLGMSEEEDGDEEEEESGEENDEGDSDESSEEDEMEQEDDSTVRTFSQNKVNEEVEKGKAVKDQLALWDQLLEGRIKIQKALVSSNQLPQPLTFPQFKKNPEFAGALKNSHKALKALQRSLLELHNQLLVQNPDTSAICLGEESDEEIISDEDDASDRQNVQAVTKRKLEMAEYPDFMAKRFAAFAPYQNTTLQKWHDKTRLTTGKSSKSFGAFERNILTQIEQILIDKDRLIKRTQTKRSEYKVMGKSERALTGENAMGAGEEPELKPNSHLKDLDEDIFDDDDFYHQLLRELIERKTSAADPNDQVAMGRQWLAIQKLRSKIKKKVDTKASKGRKVRYHVHSKLVNFMAPTDHSSMSDEAKSELYRSLFGQNSTIRE